MKPLCIFVLFSLISVALIAGCSQPQQFINCPCTCVPTTTSNTVTNAITGVATTTIPTQTETTIPVTVPTETVTPVITQSSFPSTTVPLSFQAAALIFTPYDKLNACSKYENTIGSCSAYFTWPGFSFSYRGTGYPVTIPINTGAFGAINFNLSKMNIQRQKDYNENKIGNDTYGGVGANLPLEVLSTYYNSMINDPAQDASYNYMIHYLRQIRDQNHLDDNEYAELISRFVQRTFPYINDPDRLVTKYPIETIGDTGGNCGDKSLLLAGLLSREGYGTALIWFPSGNHMIVGILGDHQALEYDGYLGVETTVDSYLGFYHTKDAFIFTLSGIPEYQVAPFMADFKVIKVSGGKPFTAGKELNFIWDQWALYKSYTTENQYQNDVSFIQGNIDNRHMVYQYLTKTGNFK
jgi:hypothetical protein